jgi:hypothetical protein
MRPEQFIVFRFHTKPSAKRIRIPADSSQNQPLHFFVIGQGSNQISEIKRQLDALPIAPALIYVRLGISLLLISAVYPLRRVASASQVLLSPEKVKFYSYAGAGE